MLRKTVLTNAFQIQKPASPVMDTTLLGAVLALLAVGLVMVGSASMDIAASAGTPHAFVIKQAIYILVGLVAMVGVLVIPVETYRKCQWVSLGIALVLLGLVLILGREINGARRWIHLGFFNLQASEVAKICVVIFMAAYLANQLHTVKKHIKGFVLPMIFFAVVVVLLLLEPDFGSVVVLAVAVLGMFFVAGARLDQFVFMMSLAGVAAYYLIFNVDYRRARLTAYTDPWADAYGSGYQLTQSQIAFGRGEWFGEGLGNSIQKLFYLPEAHTDFIFAVLAEELGMIGSLAILALFIFVSWRSFQIAHRAEAKKMMFHAFVAYGLTLLFACQSLINLGVSIGMLPTKGLALPMISYGGSSLIMNCIAFGILLRIDYERRLAKVVEEPVIAGRKRKPETTGGARNE